MTLRFGKVTFTVFLTLLISSVSHAGAGDDGKNPGRFEAKAGVGLPPRVCYDALLNEARPFPADIGVIRKLPYTVVAPVKGLTSDAIRMILLANGAGLVMKFNHGGYVDLRADGTVRASQLGGGGTPRANGSYAGAEKVGFTDSEFATGLIAYAFYNAVKTPAVVAEKVWHFLIAEAPEVAIPGGFHLSGVSSSYRPIRFKPALGLDQ